VLTVLLFPGSGRASEPVAVPGTEAVWLESNLSDLYPDHDEICLTTYEQTSDPPGVVLHLQNGIEGFSRYLVTTRRDSSRTGPVRENRSGEVPVSFDPASRHEQRIETTIRGVTKTGRRTRAYSILIVYCPHEIYAAVGQRTPDWIVVKSSDLSLCGGAVEDWIVDTPSAADRAYARRRWGRVADAYHSDYEKAKAIARDLIRTLRPHEGIPSVAMQGASGLEQLRRIERRQDRVWCGNYADIFSAACNALDIPVRKIDMQYIWSVRGRTALEIGEGHRTTEVFDRTLNRWIWIDLTLGLLGAEVRDNEPIEVARLVRVLNDPLRLPRLRLAEFDSDTGVEKFVPIAESPCERDLLRFFREDQRYKYYRRAQTTVSANGSGD
jgi:hypothetical protein